MDKAVKCVEDILLGCAAIGMIYMTGVIVVWAFTGFDVGLP